MPARSAIPRCGCRRRSPSRGRARRRCANSCAAAWVQAARCERPRWRRCSAWRRGMSRWPPPRWKSRAPRCAGRSIRRWLASSGANATCSRASIAIPWADCAARSNRCRRRMRCASCATGSTPARVRACAVRMRWPACSRSWKAGKRRRRAGKPNSCRRASPITRSTGWMRNAAPGASPGRACARPRRTPARAGAGRCARPRWCCCRGANWRAGRGSPAAGATTRRCPRAR